MALRSGWLAVWLSLSALSCSSSSDRGHSPGDGGGGGADQGTTDPGGCTGIACYQKDCMGAPTTSVSGRVTAPNGLDPVYDALVYVPTNVPEFPAGVQCEVCNEPVGGAPIVSTHTAVDGTFTLTNVPATSQVPLIVQKGRFRKQIALNIPACQDTPLTVDQARLPRKQSEGDLPKMAVGVGDYDQIECVLRSIGIDESEFTDPAGSGAVHLYDNSGDGGTSLESLLNDATKLATYNLVFVNCTNNTFNNYKTPTLTKGNLFNYVNTGGRLYVTDWSYDYMEQVPQFAPYVFFDGGGNATMPQPIGGAQYAWDGTDLTATIADPTLKMWMAASKASANGTLTIQGSWALGLSTAADQTTYPSTTWVHGNAGGKDRPMTVTYDYNMCGKVLWSSYHTQEPGGGGFGAGGQGFPSYCISTPQTMIAQEKILEFLILEISSCVGPIG
jgi:hypothetical protein